MKNSKLIKKTTVLLAISCLVVILSVLICYRKIGSTIDDTMKENLHNRSTQNASYVNREITDKFRLLFSISDEFSEQNREESFMLSHLTACQKRYDFKRMGFVLENGLGKTTDGYQVDFSKEDYFTKGMSGISQTINSVTDYISDEQIPVITFLVPFYDQQDKPRGILFGMYDTSVFQKLIHITSYDNVDYSMIMMEDGTVAVLSKSVPVPLQIGDNFLSFLQQELKTSAYAHVSEEISEMKAAWGKYSYEKELYYFYIYPLESFPNDYTTYLITIIPFEKLFDVSRPVMEHIKRLIIIITLTCIISMGIYYCIHRKQKKQLYELAYHDSLTSGDNFASFKNKLEQQQPEHSYFIAFDIQEFKIINVSCGIEKGDEVILRIWNIIHNELNDNEFGCRIHADRFFFMMIEKDHAALEKRLYRLIDQISEMTEELALPRLFPLMGIYESNEPLEAEKLYGRAVEAKHLIKGKRMRHFAYYDELDLKQMAENRQLESEFEKAIANKEFHVWYQPKINPFDGKIIGAEALVRWIKKDGTIYSPAKFIPLFEKNGNIAILDEYVFRSVCEQQKEWLDDGKELIPISVNISRVSLYYHNVVQKYRAIMDEIGLEAKYVSLEITESATINNDEISDLIEKFHKEGFFILLDDFGSGYSSLSSLNVMNFDTIKLDKSLIDYIGDPKGEKLLKYVTNLSLSLGMSITAEGVENEEQVNFLKSLKCTDIQGYYFSKPLPLDEFVRFTTANRQQHK